MYFYFRDKSKEDNFYRFYSLMKFFGYFLLLWLCVFQMIGFFEKIIYKDIIWRYV